MGARGDTKYKVPHWSNGWWYVPTSSLRPRVRAAAFAEEIWFKKDSRDACTQKGETAGSMQELHRDLWSYRQHALVSAACSISAVVFWVSFIQYLIPGCSNGDTGALGFISITLSFHSLTWKTTEPALIVTKGLVLIAFPSPEQVWDGVRGEGRLQHLLTRTPSSLTFDALGTRVLLTGTAAPRLSAYPPGPRNWHTHRHTHTHTPSRGASRLSWALAAFPQS